MARFEREMKAVGRLEHPNIVRAMDANEQDGTHYLVMEYVDGVDLAELARHLGPLSIRDACEIIRQAAEALQHAHASGLIHRDIKPSNIMLTVAAALRDADGLSRSESPTVKLLDLGLARPQEHAVEDLTSTGQAMGTLDYMAPEQCDDSHSADARADIYSLGATLYKLLTGQAPFADPKYNTLNKKVAALLTKDVRPITDHRSDLPGELVSLVHRMLAKDPAQRPATASEVADALAPLAAGADLIQLASKLPPEKTTMSQQALAEPVAIPQGTDEYLSSSMTETHSSDLKKNQPVATSSLLVEKDASPEFAATVDCLPPAARVRGRSASVGAGSPDLDIVRGRSPDLAPQSDHRSPQTSARRHFIPPRIAIATAALVGIIALGVILYINTNHGRLIIDTKVDDVKVIVESGGGQVTIIDPTTERTVKLVPGEYDIRLEDEKAGLSLSTKSFTMRRGKEVVVEVRFEPKVASGDKPDSPIPHSNEIKDRRGLMKWVLGLGGRGTVNVVRGNSYTQFTVATVDDLPDDEFTIQTINLGNVADITDQHVAILSKLVQLFHGGRLPYLGLTSTAVTDASMKYLAELELGELAVGGTRVTEDGLQYVHQIKGLKRLSLEEIGITDDGLAQLAKMRDLAALNLSGNPVTDEGLRHLGELTDLTTLSLITTKVTGEGFADLTGLTKLSTLQLQHSPVNDAGLQQASGLSSLVLLELAGGQITDAGMKHLTSLNHLTHLKLNTVPITDRGAESLSNLRQLELLSISSAQITDALAHFTKLTSLKRLILVQTKVTADGVRKLQAALPDCEIIWDGSIDANRKAAVHVINLGGRVMISIPNEPGSYGPTYASVDELPEKEFALRGVFLDKIPQFGDRDLATLSEYLRDISNARITLVLPHTGITDEGLAHLNGLSINSLSLQGLPITGNGLRHLLSVKGIVLLGLDRTRITDDDFEIIGQLNQLQSIILSYTEITGDGLKHLNDLPNLVTLNLHKTKVTGDSLQHLATHRSLQILDLGGTNATDAGLRYLSRLKSLRSLILAATGVTDAGLADLKELPVIETLGLRGTTVTDSGLQHLVGLKTLKTLDVKETKVTAEGVAKLQAALPDCEIIWDGGPTAPVQE